MMKRLRQFSALTLTLMLLFYASGCGGLGNSGGNSCTNTLELQKNDYDGGGTLEAGCYLAENGLNVTSGELTIEPGVTIEFGQNTGITVNSDGGLTAEGTESDPIVFTGAEKTRGYWTGVYIRNRTTANVFDWVTVEYAGSAAWRSYESTAGVYVEGSESSLDIQNSTFRENAEVGLYADGGGSNLNIKSSSFIENAMPLRVHPNLTGKIGSDLSFSGNDDSHVVVGAPDGSGNSITTDQTWPTLDINYRVIKEIGVEASWSLSSGATLEMAQQKGIDVYGGTLTADGSGGERIKFIAANDEQNQGYWHGIRFANTLSSDNVIKNADIRYGGSEGWRAISETRSNVLVHKDSKVALSDVRIEGSGGAGVIVDSDSSVEPCTNVTIDNNAKANVAGDGVFACSGN
jgi:hypothetical protein